MAFLGVLLASVINCIVLFFASFLAAGGDGNDDGIKTVWLFGFSWIAFFTITAMFFCARGKGKIGVAISISALPLAWLAALLMIMGKQLLGFNAG